MTSNHPLVKKLSPTRLTPKTSKGWSQIPCKVTCYSKHVDTPRLVLQVLVEIFQEEFSIFLASLSNFYETQISLKLSEKKEVPPHMKSKYNIRHFRLMEKYHLFVSFSLKLLKVT